MRAPFPSLLPAFLAFALVIAVGCGRDRRAADESAPGTPFEDGSSDASRDVPPDTSRAGPAFLAVYPDGPLDELRVVRATDGALVVAGAGEFPDGTKVTVTLLARTAAGGLEPQASARAVVDLGHFMSAPLAPVGGPPPPGIHVLRVTVPFGPGDQEDAVLRAADGGRRHRGSGMRALPGERIVFETTLEVPL